MRIFLAVCFSLVMKFCLGQTYTHEILFDTYFNKVDTTFSFDRVEEDWIIDRRTVSFYSGYDRLDRKLISKRDKELKIFQKETATIYEYPTQELSVHTNYEWLDSTALWSPTNRYTSEKFVGSNQSSFSRNDKWIKESQNWITTTLFERSYNVYNTERYEKRITYNNDGDKIANGQNVTYKINEFGEDLEEIRQKYDQKLEKWVNDRWMIYQQRSDSRIIITKFWNDDRNRWEEPTLKTVVTYYQEKEYRIELPSKCKSSHELKTKITSKLDTTSNQWKPTKMSKYLHRKVKDHYEKEELKHEWDMENKKWKEIHKYITIFNSEGKRQGHVQERYDKELKKWTPDSRNLVLPNKGYLESISEKYDKESGTWSKQRLYKFKPCYPIKLKEGA